jgi:hypothetical protein
MARTCLQAVILTAVLCAAAAKPTGYSEFSMDEFFDIKRTVSRLKIRRAAKALVQARTVDKKLQAVAPQNPVFYGQDHYQQNFDETGKETWYHVGRPVSTPSPHAVSSMCHGP